MIKQFGLAAAIIVFVYLVLALTMVRERCYTPYEGPGSSVCFYDLMYKKMPKDDTR